MTTQFKVSRAVFAFAVVVVNAATAFATVLVQYYVGQPEIALAAGAFIGTVGNGAAVLLSTEEQAAPGP